jgi:energy-coupling factor transporter transmembrane protein EcfT
MFEAIIKDPTIFEITLVLIVLAGIAFWQNLKQVAAILGGIYFMYLIFIMTSYSNDSVTLIVEEKVENKKINIDSVNIVEKESIEVDVPITKVEDKKDISTNDDESFLSSTLVIGTSTSILSFSTILTLSILIFLFSTFSSTINVTESFE